MSIYGNNCPYNLDSTPSTSPALEKREIYTGISGKSQLVSELEDLLEVRERLCGLSSPYMDT